MSNDQKFDLLKVSKNKCTCEMSTIFVPAVLPPPSIDKPTSITHGSATLVDNIYVKGCHNVCKSGIIHSDISDHFPGGVVCG